MGIASYIRIIGRGKEGARPLGEADAHDLMSQVLDGRTSDLEVGAFALAMRIKGESVDELIGFLRAAHERCLPLAHDAPVLLLPSYNGARKLPNLTPLLAWLLAREGVAVLVHGVVSDERRITSAELFDALGLPCADDAQAARARWSRHEPAFMPIEALCPPLARLLAVRRVVGVRNSGHTIAKLLDPLRGAASLRVINYTHPEYARSLADFLQRTGADAMLMRGTEGEPVADARRARRLDAYLRGELRPELSCAAAEGGLPGLELPAGSDLAATARYIDAVLNGAAAPPPPLQQQRAALLRMLEPLRERGANAEAAGADLTRALRE